MLLCPPGEFMMGSPANESGRDDDEAQQRVSITTAFYISETEVTQEQWQRTIGANPSNFKGASNPVEQVSWDDCQGFCAKTGLRLPSEAEWEYACRAGTTGAYAGDLDSMGWYGGNSRGPTHPVRQKRANPWGLYDMHGNVSEWCADGYLNRAAGMQTPVGARSYRVLRGGSWVYSARNVRSSDRNYDAPGFADDSLGFLSLLFFRFLSARCDLDAATLTHLIPTGAAEREARGGGVLVNWGVVCSPWCGAG
jgi:formylglycine-generating enzyme required for sulfatase activity